MGAQVIRQLGLVQVHAAAVANRIGDGQTAVALAALVLVIVIVMQERIDDRRNQAAASAATIRTSSRALRASKRFNQQQHARLLTCGIGGSGTSSWATASSSVLMRAAQLFASGVAAREGTVETCPLSAFSACWTR